VAFTVGADTALSPEAAWARVTDWPDHGAYVPLTRVRVATPGPTGVGTVFVARTAVGPLGFDDPMEVVEWDPPRHCRIEKRGRVLAGWAELTVEPRPSGARVTWREEAVPTRFGRRLGRLSDVAGRRVFGRVLRRLVS
jgi:hypothetical protein